MSSEQEIKEIEILGRKIAEKMGFYDLDLTIEKDKSGAVDFMRIRSYYPFKFTPKNIITYFKEKMIEKLSKEHRQKPISTLKTTIILGKYYNWKIKELLAHEFGHARFLTDHPVFYKILDFFSLPYDYLPNKLKGNNEIKIDVAAVAAEMLSILFFPYGLVSAVPVLASYTHEYIAGYEARKRGLKASTFAGYNIKR